MNVPESQIDRKANSPPLLRTDVHRKVLDRIIVGRLPPGEGINESQLAKELEVSRTPLREALLQLEREHFVCSDRGRGFFVQPMSSREIRELYPMLWTLEGLALRLSGSRSKLAVPELVRINERLRNTRDSKRALQLDGRWHETLIASCPNRRLRTTISSLRLAVQRYELLYMREHVLVSVSIQQHQEIIDAVKAAATLLALSKLEENWRFSMEELLVRLGEP